MGLRYTAGECQSFKANWVWDTFVGSTSPHLPCQHSRNSTRLPTAQDLVLPGVAGCLMEEGDELVVGGFEDLQRRGRSLVFNILSGGVRLL